MHQIKKKSVHAKNNRIDVIYRNQIKRNIIDAKVGNNYSWKNIDQQKDRKLFAIK